MKEVLEVIMYLALLVGTFSLIMMFCYSFSLYRMQFIYKAQHEAIDRISEKTQEWIMYVLQEGPQYEDIYEYSNRCDEFRFNDVHDRFKENVNLDYNFKNTMMFWKKELKDFCPNFESEYLLSPLQQRRPEINYND